MAPATAPPPGEALAWVHPRGRATMAASTSSPGSRNGPAPSLILASDRAIELLLPAHLVMGLESAPERDLRLAADAHLLHERFDLAPLLLEEGLEALGVGPLVDDHDLAVVRSVEAVGDQPVLLGPVGDAAHPVGILAGHALELLRVALHPEGQDH